MEIVGKKHYSHSACVLMLKLKKTHTHHLLAGKENVAALLTLGTSKATQSSSWFLLSSQRLRQRPKPTRHSSTTLATNLLYWELSLDSRSTASWELQRKLYFTYTCQNKWSLCLWKVNDCSSRCHLPCCSNAAALSATGRRWLHLGHVATPWSLSRLDGKEGKEKIGIAEILPMKIENITTSDDDHDGKWTCRIKVWVQNLKKGIAFSFIMYLDSNNICANTHKNKHTYNPI